MSQSPSKQNESTLHFATDACALGHVLIARVCEANSAKGICFLSVGDDPSSQLSELAAAFPHHELVEAPESFQTLLADVRQFVEQPTRSLVLPLDLRGTSFQKRVWEALVQTSPGETITYRGLAERIGSPGSSRAVGAACGQNQIALAVPCHRAVRSDGKDSGFRWGLERKRELLDRERVLHGPSHPTGKNQLQLAGFDAPFPNPKSPTHFCSTPLRQPQT
ncbi:DNA-O6-methylguanine--protein-cysteine S-methyltransferase / transcriptional regulator Ada [Rhodopirellula baltica SH28]|uniref:methylated-DNA--[protein]-cysteine S-methyltransferase n=1 Tax=Rhodopirellula baltica SH28 TaxID=993517 RepID=K5CE89_RHOBT|nr:methylated-DNA--[protein]-cysteine S-methyltransferase [Rhodopirellula baltica]EKK02075.1 DNA-O6-methylguanine--protein-cysteine S-methyltransferase / transcriptional regulator Ada [Rhodopirellula baltica SH28]